MELYAYRENGEFIGTIDFYTSLRWRRQYWTAGEVELHLPATKENLAAIRAGVILRRVGYTESARIMGIKTKGGEITANARMLEIYFSRPMSSERNPSRARLPKSFANWPKMPANPCPNLSLTKRHYPAAQKSRFSWTSKTR